MRFFRSTTREYGFSLIELMVALGIFSVVLAAAYGVYVSSTRTATVQNVSAGVQQTIRTALDIMAQDIRMAGYDPTTTSNASIEIAESNKIQVRSDRNEDGDTDDPKENIIYELDGDQLKKNNQYLINNVNDLQFIYWDTDGNDLGTSPTLSDIRSVTISLEIEEPAGLGNPVSRRLETRVHCRNL